MGAPYRLLRPLLFQLDPERAHGLAARAAGLAQLVLPAAVRAGFVFENERLAQDLWGMHFRNPIGLAAGFDKNARLVQFWEELGFGFAEIGSVSARPAAGNPQPRLFRLPEDEALVNRMGLNNDGAESVAQRLEAARPSVGIPIGINLAKTHDPAILGDEGIEDFRLSLSRLGKLASYLAVNISCPNTTEGKTFEEPEILDRLLRVLMKERGASCPAVPMLLKLSPPASRAGSEADTDEIIDVALSHGIDGFIATNTAPDRDGLKAASVVLERLGRGGLSGRPLHDRSTRMIRHLYRRIGRRVPVIGVGGVSSAASAYEKIRAGAHLVQLYTGLVYEGPGLVRKIKQDLIRVMDIDRMTTITEAVGVDA